MFDTICQHVGTHHVWTAAAAAGVFTELHPGIHDNSSTLSELACFSASGMYHIGLSACPTEVTVLEPKRAWIHCALHVMLAKKVADRSLSS